MKNRIAVLVIHILAYFFVQNVAGQKMSLVSGVVTDSNGEELPGVTIRVKGTSNGAVTGIDGSYSLTVSEGQTLVFSFVGFEDQEILVGAQDLTFTSRCDTREMPLNPLPCMILKMTA